MPATRGQFTIRVKEELAALRPPTPQERRALLAGLLRFAATLHIGGLVEGPGPPGGPPAPAARDGAGMVSGGSEASGGPGPRVTLVLASRPGGVARLGFWLLQG